MTDWTNADHADGPALAAWLTENNYLPSHEHNGPHESLHTAVRRWRNGDRATIESADRWLTYQGLHLSQVPDDCWREPIPRKVSQRDPVRSATALAAVAMGASYTEAARLIGANRKTVRGWHRAMEKAA